MSDLASTLAASVMSRCDELGTCSEEAGRITRRYLSEPMHAVHARVSEWMREAGLEVRVDDAGNIVGRREGRCSKVLIVGSHLDSVPGAGRYDGVLGVMVGVAVAEALRHEELPFCLDVIGFSEEEGIRYRMPYLGSAAVAGRFDEAWLERFDDEGISLRSCLSRFGLQPDNLSQSAYDPGEVVGYFEPHVEQGPVLERADVPLGVVTGIAGQSRLRLEFVGEPGHAGTTPMADRSDALVAAATFIGKVREVAAGLAGLRATVGSVQVAPNAPNVIPGRVELSLDVRHLDNAVRLAGIRELLEAAEQSAEGENCRFRLLEDNSQNAVAADGRMMFALEETIAECGYPVLQLESGAGHDAVIMGQSFPMAMLFLRHPGGISHHPDERVLVEDVAVAIAVITRYVLKLADQFSNLESTS
ncbi:allantoate amidohydrolase [Aeoliella sp. SH292]|uniref:allantoate amidohydrolase n=1 Tax=Aeoliella sp. SH292 TaxID=3454464 RepID=UPI003F9C1395